MAATAAAKKGNTVGADITIIGTYFEMLRRDHEKAGEPLWAAYRAVPMSDDDRRTIAAVVNGWTDYKTLDRHARILYASPAGKALRAAAKALDKHNAVEPGYFRDSYNNTSIMWRLGLSWWQLAGVGGADQAKGIQLIDDDGHMSLVSIKMLRDAVVAAPVKLLDRASGDDSEWLSRLTDKEVISWNKFFATRKRKLVAFLNSALKNRATISASV